METQEIGYISKTHGLKGHVNFRLFDDLAIDDENITALFLEMGSSQVPFFIEEIKYATNSYLVKFEGINTIDESKKLIGKKAFCLPEFIIVNEDSLSEFIGYTVIDAQKGNIGIITEIDEKTENVIIKVLHPSGNEIILPFNDDLVEEIDDDAKTINFNAPEGLIDMYLA